MAAKELIARKVHPSRTNQHRTAHTARGGARRQNTHSLVTSCPLKATLRICLVVGGTAWSYLWINSRVCVCVRLVSTILTIAPSPFLVISLLTMSRELKEKDQKKPSSNTAGVEMTGTARYYTFMSNESSRTDVVFQ